jgi:hypothetical protein
VGEFAYQVQHVTARRVKFALPDQDSHGCAGHREGIDLQQSEASKGLCCYPAAGASVALVALDRFRCLVRNYERLPSALAASAFRRVHYVHSRRTDYAKFPTHTRHRITP